MADYDDIESKGDNIGRAFGRPASPPNRTKDCAATQPTSPPTETRSWRMWFAMKPGG